jgi:hypothetical protein
MKLTIEATDVVTTLVADRGAGPSIEARLWEGRTESGIPVTVFVTRLAVAREEDQAAFEAELVETRPPTGDLAAAVPARMIL